MPRMEKKIKGCSLKGELLCGHSGYLLLECIYMRKK